VRRPVVVALSRSSPRSNKPRHSHVLTLAFGLGTHIALNALPKPGEWMVQVKKAMGFVPSPWPLFPRAVIGETPFRLGVAVSLLIGAIFLFASRGQRGRVMRLACATILLVGGVAFAIPPRKGAEVTWQKYDAAAVTASAGKPVIIDFFATWCIPCKELDEKTFNDAAVAKDLDRFTRIKADLTNGDDPLVRELTKRYAIVGVPTVVFLDSAGHEQQQLRLTGFEKPEQFLARTKQVK
jgi:thiol:disulfide interchange protein DsbD